MSRIAANRRRSAGIADRVSDPPIILLKKSSSSSSMRGFFKCSQPTMDEPAYHMEQASIHLMKMAEHFRKAGDKMHKCAQSQNNSAIEDISNSLKQVLMMYCEQQLVFAQSISDVAQDIKRMKDEHEELVQVEKKIKQLGAEDKKIEKELSKMKLDSPSGSSENGMILRSKLNERLQIAKAQENAEKLAHRYRNDSEITKMFVFRRCLKSVADAFLENAQKVSIIFGAIRELAELVPAIATEDVYHVRYEGGEVSKRKLREVRRSLEQPIAIHEESESRLLSTPTHKVPLTPLKMGSSYKTTSKASPPPPYSPGTKFVR